MCRQISYTLPCDHVYADFKYCENARSSKSSSTGKKPCKSLKQKSLPYPSQPRPIDGRSITSPPRCPVSDCPYETRNRYWNCCWCGKSENMRARCDSIMQSDGNEYPCEHLCCNNCTAAA